MIYHCVFCYSLLGLFIVPLGLKIPWVMSNLMRMECSMGQICNETVLLGSTGQKAAIAKRRMASSEPGKFA